VIEQHELMCVCVRQVCEAAVMLICLEHTHNRHWDEAQPALGLASMQLHRFELHRHAPAELLELRHAAHLLL
jgi:hypothetical protein